MPNRNLPLARKLLNNGRYLQEYERIVSNGMNDPIYRFVHGRDHASSFKNGDIYISTMQNCREYENKSRGDRDEGRIKYAITDYMCDKSTPGFEEAMRRVGFWPISGNPTMSFKNCAVINDLGNSYVLCTTLKHIPNILSKDFGDHCFKIEDPALFGLVIARRIQLEDKCDLDFKIGHVAYTGRVFEDINADHHHPFFIKPKEYEAQKELRMVWTIRNNNSYKYTGRVVRCQELRSLISRVQQSFATTQDE